MQTRVFGVMVANVSFYTRVPPFKASTCKSVLICITKGSQISYERIRSMEAVRNFPKQPAKPIPVVRAQLSPITANWSGMCH